MSLQCWLQCSRFWSLLSRAELYCLRPGGFWSDLSEEEDVPVRKRWAWRKQIHEICFLRLPGDPLAPLRLGCFIKCLRFFNKSSGLYTLISDCILSKSLVQIWFYFIYLNILLPTLPSLFTFVHIYTWLIFVTKWKKNKQFVLQHK